MTVTSILMNKNLPLVSVRPTARVESVIELMKINAVGSVVVMDDRGQLEGVITERDLLKAIDTRLCVIQSLQARDIMSSRVVTCTVDDTEAALMERMVDSGVQYLPVVAGGETIAVVSMKRPGVSPSRLALPAILWRTAPAKPIAMRKRAARTSRSQASSAL